MSFYEKTFEDAQGDYSLKQVSNVCSDSEQFKSLLNEVSQSLLMRGKLFDSEKRIRFCISGCHVVWPHFVSAILGVKFCDGLATMQNQWFSFVNNNMGGGYGGYGYGSNYSGGFGGLSEYSNGIGACIIEDDGTRPCYNEVTGTTGKLIQYGVVKSQDIGKTITLFGRKYGSQPLQEMTGNTWVNGVTLTAATPYVRSSELVTQIDAITRDATEGMAYLYEYDPATGLLRDLATFQPYETNPRYRASRIMNVPHGTRDSNGVCWTSIEALVQLKFIPVKNPRDFLSISNFKVLKLGIQATNFSNDGDAVNANVYWNMALEELRIEQDYLQPKRQIPIRVNLGRTICNPI